MGVDELHIREIRERPVRAKLTLWGEMYRVFPAQPREQVEGFVLFKPIAVAWIQLCQGQRMGINLRCYAPTRTHLSV